MSELLGLCEKAVRWAEKAGADDAEAFGVDGREVEVFLERNDVKLGKGQLRSGLGLRVLRDRGLGFASTNSLEADRVREAVDRAVRLASKAPKDPHATLPEARTVRAVPGLYDPEAEGFRAEDALEQATAMLEAARDVDPRVTVDGGVFNAAVGEKAIASTQGAEAHERGSLFTYYLIGFAREGAEVGSFDYLFEGTHAVEEIEAEVMGRRLGERVVAAMGARPTESFRGTVLLTPYTVQPLVADLLAAAVNANNVQKGMSRLAGRMGQEIATHRLTVRDDGSLPGGLGSSAFDREGVPHLPLTVVEEGVLRSYLYNAYTAAKEGRETTGHAAGDQRNVPNIGPTNLVLEPGDAPRDALVEEIERGVLVTRFSGWPQAISGDFSGAVKGGFLIEKGEVVRPVRETLVAGNVFDLLERLSGVSRETEAVFNYRLPFLRFEDVSITSG